ncbi:hypothetical protein QBC39DRAFT_339610 [Podospora conica]|nr:hypothetical protein QBC39DRAFT_339610 [Schizothecium conicum]
MSHVSDGNVAQVLAITDLGEEHRETVMNALRRNNIEGVINEYFNDPDQFIKTNTGKYWDETSWGANREGEFTSSNNPPSFAVHSVPEESGVLYGESPGYYEGSAAPSRPPSRVNNRSPMSNVADMKAGGFLNDGPSSKTEEDEQLQRAMAESLSANGGQHPSGQIPIPQSLPPPPPPQQSGVTDTNKHFGPANRAEYNPAEWAMVPSKQLDDDPAPLDRKRSHDTPAFLRNRDLLWKCSRLGGIIMALHAIPMARNALLRTGDEPEYGYGHNPDWWKGDVILPPYLQLTKDAQPDGVWASELFPPLADELHRLVAFLDLTDRSYGTADIVGDIKTITQGTGDRERDFFEQLHHDPASTPFRAEVVTMEGGVDPAYAQSSSVVLLNSQATRQEIEATTDRLRLEDLLNLIFFGSPSAQQTDPPSDRTAMITVAPEVLVLRSANEDPWPENVEVEENLFLDRYMSKNYQVALEEKRQLAAVEADLAKNYDQERQLTTRTNPSTNREADCRVLAPIAIGRYKDRIKRIKQSARWRNHTDRENFANGTNELYLPNDEEPDLLPEEAEIVAHWEARVKSWQSDLVKVEEIMRDIILPERERCKNLKQAIRDAHRASAVGNDHRYSLRGVIPTTNTVFLRKREPSLMEMEDKSEPIEQWWKMSCIPEEKHAILAEMTTFEQVLSQGCAKQNPILIFATDKAMEDAADPLSDALKTFVKLDNRYFKQEISKQEEEIPDRLDGAALTRSALRDMHKPRERSGSIDSMATNKASVGDSDEDMPDVGSGDVLPGLVDVSDGGPQEMQERDKSPLFTMPANNGPAGVMYDES